MIFPCQKDILSSYFVSTEILLGYSINDLFLCFQRVREETELQMAEENIRIKEMELLAKQLDQENKSRNNDSLATHYRPYLDQLNKQKDKFMNELDKVGAEL